MSNMLLLAFLSQGIKDDLSMVMMEILTLQTLRKYNVLYTLLVYLELLKELSEVISYFLFMEVIRTELGTLYGKM